LWSGGVSLRTRAWEHEQPLTAIKHMRHCGASVVLREVGVEGKKDGRDDFFFKTLTGQGNVKL